MSRYNDKFVGRRYGRLIVQRVASSIGYKVLWYCQCDCGRHAVASDGDLTRGVIKSCGRSQCEAIANMQRAAPTYAS